MVLKIPICVLYSHMKKNHGWLYGEKDFKNWKGCLDGVLAERYAQRHKEYVSSQTCKILIDQNILFSQQHCSFHYYTRMMKDMVWYTRPKL